MHYSCSVEFDLIVTAMRFPSVVRSAKKTIRTLSMDLKGMPLRGSRIEVDPDPAKNLMIAVIKKHARPARIGLTVCIPLPSIRGGIWPEHGEDGGTGKYGIDRGENLVTLLMTIFEGRASPPAPFGIPVRRHPSEPVGAEAGPTLRSVCGVGRMDSRFFFERASLTPHEHFRGANDGLRRAGLRARPV